MGSDLLAPVRRSSAARCSIAGGAIIALALIPGLPKLPFLLVGGAVLVLAQRLPTQDGSGADAARGSARQPRSRRRPRPDTPGGASPATCGSSRWSSSSPTT